MSSLKLFMWTRTIVTDFFQIQTLDRYCVLKIEIIKNQILRKKLKQVEGFAPKSDCVQDEKKNPLLRSTTL